MKKPVATLKTRLLSRIEYDEWLKILPKNTCTFCEYKKYQIILDEDDNWVWIANIAPYWRWHTMFVPKRHFVEFSEMTPEELGDLMKIYKRAIAKFRFKHLKRKDGSPIKKYVLFWRMRDDLLDKISGNIRPNHFHLHFTPDKDHLWDPTLDGDAHLFDIEEELK